ncbi:MAG: hypothetical protein K0Q73_1170, partial [Paenibacillus sp.]|nr:hypothetical protein [Paenibacillus sp.]
MDQNTQLHKNFFPLSDQKLHSFPAVRIT